MVAYEGEVSLKTTIPRFEETTPRVNDIEAIEPVLDEDPTQMGSIDEANSPPVDLMQNADNGRCSQGQLHGVLEETRTNGTAESSNPVDFLEEEGKETYEAAEASSIERLDLSGSGQMTMQDSTRVEALTTLAITDLSNTSNTGMQNLGAGATTKPLQTDSPNLSEIVLLGLPSDALHAITSFLSPEDCCNFGVCSSGASKVLREVLRKVRMHGFRCATEVVTAWVSAFDQHSLSFVHSFAALSSTNLCSAFRWCRF